MKTLADFKRALTVGSKWHATSYDSRGNPMTLGCRSVAKIQSNSVAFSRPDTHALSWLQFPKASEFAIDENGDVEIWWPAHNEPSFKTERKLAVRYKRIML